MQQATLCVIADRNQNKILLGMKKKGFGEGKFNGFGGKPNPGETIEEAAIRELEEEAGLRANELKKLGEITFLFPHAPADKNWNQVVHIFLIKDWSGEPLESDEMRPEWFPLNEIPYPKMWADDKHWLPHVLQEKFVKATFIFGPDGETIIEHEMSVV